MFIAMAIEFKTQKANTQDLSRLWAKGPANFGVICFKIVALSVLAAGKQQISSWGPYSQCCCGSHVLRIRSVVALDYFDGDVLFVFCC